MKLNITMFCKGGIFDMDADKYFRKMTYQGKWQRLDMFHQFKDHLDRPRNKFYIRGLNDYDRMEVDTTEKLKAVAVLMGYDEEIINVIEKLGQDETDTRQ